MNTFKFSQVTIDRLNAVEGDAYTALAFACVEGGVAKLTKADFFRHVREVCGLTCASQVLCHGLKLGKEGKGHAAIAEGMKSKAAEKATQDKIDREEKAAAAALALETAKNAVAAPVAAPVAVSPLSLTDGLEKLDLAALEAYKASLVRALFATRQAIRAKKAQEAANNAPEVIVAAIKEGVHPLTQAEIEQGDKARRLARLERKGILRAQVA